MSLVFIVPFRARIMFRRAESSEMRAKSSFYYRAEERKISSNYGEYSSAFFSIRAIFTHFQKVLTLKINLSVLVPAVTFMFVDGLTLFSGEPQRFEDGSQHQVFVFEEKFVKIGCVKFQ